MPLRPCSSPSVTPPPPPAGGASKQLVRWNPLTGKVDGVDGLDGGRNKGGSQHVPSSSSGGGAGGGDETDEGEDDLEGVLERFEWYRRLFDFSGDIPPPESAGYGPDEDPDQNLVPQVRELCEASWTRQQVPTRVTYGARNGMCGLAGVPFFVCPLR